MNEENKSQWTCRGDCTTGVEWMLNRCIRPTIRRIVDRMMRLAYMQSVINVHEGTSIREAGKGYGMSRFRPLKLNEAAHGVILDTYMALTYDYLALMGSDDDIPVMRQMEYFECPSEYRQDKNTIAGLINLLIMYETDPGCREGMVLMRRRATSRHASLKNLLQFFRRRQYLELQVNPIMIWKMPERDHYLGLEYFRLALIELLDVSAGMRRYICGEVLDRDYLPVYHKAEYAGFVEMLGYKKLDPKKLEAEFKHVHKEFRGLVEGCRGEDFTKAVRDENARKLFANILSEYCVRDKPAVQSSEPCEGHDDHR